MALFICKNCDIRQTVSDEDIGKTLECPECQTPITITSEEDSSNDEIVYGKFSLRFNAIAIDGIIQALVLILVQFFVTVPNIVNIIFMILYVTYFHQTKEMATPGKRIMGLIVVDKEAERIGIVRSFIRGVFSTLLGYIVIGHLFALFGKKRALHDMIAGTYVIEKKKLSTGFVTLTSLAVVLVWFFIMIFYVGKSITVDPSTIEDPVLREKIIKNQEKLKELRESWGKLQNQ